MGAWRREDPDERFLLRHTRKYENVLERDAVRRGSRNNFEDHHEGYVVQFAPVSLLTR